MSEDEPQRITLKTEEEVLNTLAMAMEAVAGGVMTKDQAQGIAALADIALLAIRQQNPGKYGFFYWNSPYLYGPYGSTIKIQP